MTCIETFDISEYVDDALPAGARAHVEAHLASCSRCRALAADFRTLRSLAGTLEPVAPPPQVWQRVASRLEAPRRERLWSGLFAWRVLPAAATAVLAVAALSWLGAALTRPDAHLTGAGGDGAVARVETPSGAQLAEAELTSAIAGLEQIASDTRQSLDPAMADLIASNLAVIDDAIDESRMALTVDPDSDLVQDTLFDALNHKMALLEDTVALMHDAQMDLGGGTTTLNDVNP